MDAGELGAALCCSSFLLSFCNFPGCVSIFMGPGLGGGQRGGRTDRGWSGLWTGNICCIR